MAKRIVRRAKGMAAGVYIRSGGAVLGAVIVVTRNRRAGVLGKCVVLIYCTALGWSPRGVIVCR